MARYVLLEFVENADAEEFVERINEDCAFRRKEGLSFPKRVVGIFVKPGKTCQCTDGHRSNYGDKNYGFAEILLGERFGWWVCSRCKRPRKAGHQLRNQLLPSETYEGQSFQDYEFGVTQLSISGFHIDQIDRRKKLRRKKKK